MDSEKPRKDQGGYLSGLCMGEAHVYLPDSNLIVVETFK